MYLLRSLKQILTGASGNTMPLLIKASQGENMTQPLVGKQILIVEDEPVFRSLLDSWFSFGSDNGIGRRRGGCPGVDGAFYP